MPRKGRSNQTRAIKASTCLLNSGPPWPQLCFHSRCPFPPGTLTQGLERVLSTWRPPQEGNILGQVTVSHDSSALRPAEQRQELLHGQLVSTVGPQPLSQVTQGFLPPCLPRPLSCPAHPRSPASMSTGLPLLEAILFGGFLRGPKFRPEGRARLGEGPAPSHSGNFFKRHPCSHGSSLWCYNSGNNHCIICKR